MIKPETIAVIKATVPVLQAHGEALTRLFYQRMFENNPEVKPFFNQAHQSAGSQQRALAAAVCAYAENIDNPAVLSNAVSLIANKHASLGILPEHYPIVGQNLLAAIKELLGDAATDEILNAWAEAYQVLADIFIAQENTIYQQHQQTHGWSGFKPFKVVKRKAESQVISSFYLEPEDAKPLVQGLAGQYITVRIDTDDGQQHLRNYSLSSNTMTDSYRISVKRESATVPSAPNGIVSNFLHDHINDGDTIWVGPPCGDFTLNSSDDRPVVFIAGGVGITPLLAMLQQRLTETHSQPTTLIQAAINGDTHAFSDEISVLNAEHEQFEWHVRYSEPTSLDREKGQFDSEGVIDEALLTTYDKSADYYLCGPAAMMQQCYSLLKQIGVSSERIHMESFGPALQLG